MHYYVYTMYLCINLLDERPAVIPTAAISPILPPPPPLAPPFITYSFFDTSAVPIAMVFLIDRCPVSQRALVHH